VLFPNRVMLGVGTGESLNEVPAIGIAWPEFRERFARLREAVTLMRRLWSDERVTYEGTYYKTHNATIYDKPRGGIPLLIAAGGPQMARYAGRMGDGMIVTSGKGAELYREQLLPAFEEGAGESGRDPSKLDKMIEVKVSFDTDYNRAMEDTRHWAALALTPEEKVNVEDPLEMERLAAALPLERAASRWIVSADPEEQLAQIRPYVELGFTHLVFHAPGPDQSRFLKLYAEQVLPLLRAKLG
jgi:coenzyme F420-dependent glucose-6-phosphate dehydrogenase